MQTLLLTRQPPVGKAVHGTLTLRDDANHPSPLTGGWGVLENLNYIIPTGTYTVIVTWSPRFKRPLPLVCNVPKIVYSPPPSGGRGVRTGIRFHRGSLPEHSKGCILLRTTKEVNDITSFIAANEKVLLHIVDAPSQ